MTDPRNTQPRVVFIASWERSGSTLLGNILGGLKDASTAGELHQLWHDFKTSPRTCGCGLPLESCPLWREVLIELSRRIGPDGIEDARILRSRLAHSRNTLRILSTRTSQDVEKYTRITQALYESLTTVTRTSVIVDSSKAPPFAALLTRMTRIRPYLIHLIRDPRAAAHSWHRGPIGELKRSVLYSSTRWTIWNLLIERVAAALPPQQKITIHYEDFATEPTRILQDITRLLEREPSELKLGSNNEIVISRHHTVHGNPLRLKHGVVPIALDDEWREALSTLHFATATLASFPLLHRYGYKIRKSLPAMDRR